MFAMLEAKLPPPSPAVEAASAISQKGVWGRCTRTARLAAGIRSRSALTTVQLRPPNFGTAKVYGKRMIDPTSPGTETSVKSCAVVYLNPAAGSRVAAMLHTSHTEKPMFSARIDQMRFRRAIDRPVASQKCGSSGFQSLIHLDIICLPCECNRRGMCKVDAGDRRPAAQSETAPRQAYGLVVLLLDPDKIVLSRSVKVAASVRRGERARLEPLRSRAAQNDLTVPRDAAPDELV